MTVYVIHKPRPTARGPIYDLSPAQEYGDIKFVFDSNYSPSQRPRDAFEVAERALETFDCEKDYIVWAGGDPFGLLLMGAVLASITDRVRFLKWEKHRSPRSDGAAGYYAPIDVPLPMPLGDSV